MNWLGLGWHTREQEEERERARQRLLEQERRVQAIDRAVEVIQRTLTEDHPHAGK